MADFICSQKIVKNYGNSVQQGLPIQTGPPANASCDLPALSKSSTGGLGRRKSLNDALVSNQNVTSHGSAVMVSFQGEMLALGKNKNGCLGLESNEAREPLKVHGLPLVSGVSVCDGFGDGVAYTREGKLYHWGANVHGNTCKQPVLLENIPSIIDARCVRGHYMALTRDGKVYEWRGNKTYEDRLNTLSTIPTDMLKNDIVGIACGPCHSLAVTKLGEVYSFGVKCNPNQLFENQSRRRAFGIKPRPEIPSPLSNQWVNEPELQNLLNQPATKLTIPGETVAKVACGLENSLALTQSGKVYTWGYKDGYLADGSQTQFPNTPVQVGGNIGRFEDIAMNGWETIAAITNTGAVYMWGKDDKGNAVNSPTLTPHTELQQVFSNICPSNCSWTYKDSYSVTHEDPALLGREMASTFNVENFSDLTILVGKKAIYVHKYILNLRSKFFQTNRERWADKSKRQLELTCYDYEVYLSYLWYLYSGEIKISPQHIIDLWDFAVSNGEKKLKLGCQHLISKNMAPEMILHLNKSRTMKQSLLDVENKNSKPLENKINEIKADYESRCQTLKAEYESALKNLKKEYKPAQDASQFAQLSVLLELEDLNTEQAVVGRKLELKVAELEAENLELRKLKSKLDEEQKLRRELEEDNSKLIEVISKLKSNQANSKMIFTKLESDPTILQQVFKIPVYNSTNPESAQLGTSEKKRDEKGDIEKPDTVKLKIKEIDTKTQTCQTEMKETDNKVDKDDLETAGIHNEEDRSYEELLEEYTELQKCYRKLEKEKSNIEEEYNRLQEKHKKLKDFLR